MRRSAPFPAAAGRRAVAFLALSAMLATQNAHGFTVATVPLTLPTPPPANIVVTLDDSGSMERAYAPDGIFGTCNTRRAKSADFNPLYYNPGIRYDPPPNADGTVRTTSFTSALQNGFDNSIASVNLSTNYRVTWNFNPRSDDSSSSPSSDCSSRLVEHPAQEYTTEGQRRQGQPAYYYVFIATLPNCDGTRTDDDCYQQRIVGNQNGPADMTGDGLINGDDERQNFANWYSFYRTRNLLTISAAAIAFSNPALAATRVAWQSLNSCNDGFSASNPDCEGIGNVDVDPRIRTFNDTHRGNMYRWLFYLPASGFTPLRPAMTRAGEYFRTSTAGGNTNTPYAENPQVSAGTEFSCRPNFHILMTDGIWNGGEGQCSGSSCGNADGTALTLPDGTSYSTTAAQTAIYRDSSSNTVSDLAFHYWATDLRTDLANNLRPYMVAPADVTAGSTTITPYWNPRNDPATWQHMVTFTVGLGLTTSLTENNLVWGGETWLGAGYNNLLAGTATWPAAASNASPGNVYDLWHAAINSRGEAFSADNPVQLANALNTSLNRVLDRSSGAAAAAVSSRRSGSDTLVFQTLVNSAGWSSELRAFRLNADGTLGAQEWSTADAGKIPAWSTRQNHAFTWSGSAGVPFTQSGMDTAVDDADAWGQIVQATAPATAFTVAREADDIRRYILGDQSKEQRRLATGIYRFRATPTGSGPLGDIVNSDPVYVSNQRYSYAALPEGGPSSTAPYLDFVATKATRRKMLYVGSNGGMLHGFDASPNVATATPPSPGGTERFAYIPGAVLGNLRQLASPTYGHRFFVDGTPTVNDAFFSDAWHTVLVGTTGAGGRGVFAINITNPDALNASSILWEINSTTPYDSTRDSSDPDYDQDLGFTINEAQIGRMHNGDWVAVFGNGFRSPRERSVLYIVRLRDGALLRKFDTGAGSATAPNGMSTPLMVDADRDQITDYIYAGDMLGNVWKFDVRDPTPANWNIAFSGNPMFTATNAAGTVRQPISVRLRAFPAPGSVGGRMLLFGTGRLWAVNDNTDTAAQTFYGLLDNDSSVISGRSVLQQQTISSPATGQRNISTNAVNYGTQRGWYIDLPDTRERVIRPAQLEPGRLLITSVVPSPDPCSVGGTTWLMQLNPQTGARALSSYFIVNGTQVNVSGVSSEGITTSFALLDGAAIGSNTGGPNLNRIGRDMPIEDGRDAWREVVQ